MVIVILAFSQCRLPDLRVAPDFLRRTFGDYLTLRQYADAIGHGEDDVHIVLDNDLSHAAHLDLLEQFDGGVRIMSGHSAVGSSRRSERGSWMRPMANSRRRLSPQERLPTN